MSDPFQKIGYLTRDESLVPPRLLLWKRVTCAQVLPDIFPECTDAFNVYWVDGFYLRNNITVEFDDGGNPGAYPTITNIFRGHAWSYTFIPEGEIWLEVTGDLSDTRDEQFVLEHEVYECHLMSHFGQGYEEAHGQAQHIERLSRQKYRDPERLWTEGIIPTDLGAMESEKAPGPAAAVLAPDRMALVEAVIAERRRR